jgi:hypothetical protein
MLEAKVQDDELKNVMAQPAPNPETPEEWVRAMYITMKNLDALKPHQRDVDGMWLNLLTSGPFLSTLWKVVTKLLPIAPKILEKAEKY